MNECAVCGILYLAGPSCPACGSQLRVQDPSFSDSDAAMPTEVPGLDDAAQAWYDLEGIEAPVELEEEPASSLPFGFGGESQTHISRLPFGIGSHPEGIPFELSGQEPNPEEEPSLESAKPVVVPVTLEPAVLLEAKQDDALEESTIIEKVPSPLPVEAPDLPLIEEPTAPAPIRLTAIPLVEAAVDISDLPNEWSIESFGGSDQIFTAEEDIIEVVFSDLEDTVYMSNMMAKIIRRRKRILSTQNNHSNHSIYTLHRPYGGCWDRFYINDSLGVWIYIHWTG